MTSLDWLATALRCKSSKSASADESNCASSLASICQLAARACANQSPEVEELDADKLEADELGGGLDAASAWLSVFGRRSILAIVQIKVAYFLALLFFSLSNLINPSIPLALTSWAN